MEAQIHFGKDSDTYLRHFEEKCAEYAVGEIKEKPAAQIKILLAAIIEQTSIIDTSAENKI